MSEKNDISSPENEKPTDAVQAPPAENVEHLEEENVEHLAEESVEHLEPKQSEPIAPEKPKKSGKSSDKDKNDKAPVTPIIRKIKKTAGGHHGGAWKIAFADFVTAMMAFFLLMWLVASLNKAQKAGISDYFKQPMNISLFGGESITDKKENSTGGGVDQKITEGKETTTKSTNSDKTTTEQKQLLDSNKEELKKLEELKSEINLSIQKDPGLSGLKDQMLMDITSDGLRIQLVDNQKKPMFDVGSDKISPDVEPILANIAKLLNSVKNKVTIQGHTDANPYDNPSELDYTNWELSSQRANAARRALIKAGLNEDKVMTVTGFSSTVLLDKSNPYNPENRRISIIVMKKGAEDKITDNK